MSEDPYGSVAVHPAGPAAAPAIAAMLDRCSTSTIFHRMLGLSSNAREQLVDPVRHNRPCGRLDLVAEAARAVVGWGCLVPDGDVWEVAVVVEDAWQGRGVGDRLAAELLRSAAAQGVLPVRAVTAPGNRRVVTLIRRRAEVVEPPTMSVDEIEFWLAPKGSPAR